MSPSSQRAWIEMLCLTAGIGSLYVALLAEGVDRNSIIEIVSLATKGRPPRRGRG